MRLDRLNSEAGFTLLEAMVALTIFAVALVTILNLFSGSLDSARVTRDYTLGLILAQSKMAELESGLEEGRTGGVGDEYEDFGWEAEIQPAGFKDIEQVRLKVTWPGKVRGKEIELSTLRCTKGE